ncbi:uncharacterized protein LOC752317 [Strongylocentrotus purpuratus]|uniref:Fibrinogen C-terminal domain-containing protein n=1 Tax=Strongylocentrotus purpuratus TaxID=7668 RepID=A0A7M7P056_STRPU|nr:uncharacterized protein LOC752317 [Strongylocentrotus purpuratus]
MTTTVKCGLLIEITDAAGFSLYATFLAFELGGEETSYQISIGDYDGTAGEDPSPQLTGLRFSTEDNDRSSSGTLMSTIGGGWWVDTTAYTNLNGVYQPSGVSPSEGQGLYWSYTPSGHKTSYTISKMTIKQLSTYPTNADLAPASARAPDSDATTKASSTAVVYPADVVMQSRSSGSLDFSVRWQDYVDGFSDETELWIGLEYIHKMTTTVKCGLLIEITDAAGFSLYATFLAFELGGEETSYQISIGDYDGTAGEDPSPQLTGLRFSTEDNDRSSSGTLMSTIGGGWWVDTTAYTNLNGVYQPSGVSPSEGQGLYWSYTPSGHKTSYTISKMTIKQLSTYPTNADLAPASARAPDSDATTKASSTAVVYPADVVMQSRSSGSLDFSRTWQEYVDGFSDETELWIGLDYIYKMTTTVKCGLLIEITDAAGFSLYATFLAFELAGEDTYYQINIGDYDGTAGEDPSPNLTGLPFSTEDKDLSSTGTLMSTLRGGWWVDTTAYTNLNGVYQPSGVSPSEGQGLYWSYTASGHKTSYMISKMTIKQLSTYPTHADLAPASATTASNAAVEYPADVVMQSRSSGSLDFSRTWQEYVDGFSDETELWIGLDYIYKMTTTVKCGLLIEITDAAGFSLYAAFLAFELAGEDTYYRINIGDYDGTAGEDPSPNLTGLPFSTEDKDLSSTGTLMSTLRGGWWVDTTAYTNLNGVYQPSGVSPSEGQGLYWSYTASGHKTSYTISKMTIKQLSTYPTHADLAPASASKPAGDSDDAALAPAGDSDDAALAPAGDSDAAAPDLAPASPIR